MRAVPFAFIVATFALISIGCNRAEPLPAPPPPPPTAWFASDSLASADQLAVEVLKRPWINEFRDRTARVPVLRVGPFNDKSDGEVDINTFINDLSKAIGRSTAVRIAEIGGPADFSLKGTIGFQDAESGSIRHYQLDLALVDSKGESVSTPIAIERTKENLPAK